MKLFKALVLTGCVAFLGMAGSAEARPVMCPMIYKPVCAVRHGTARTYGNACQARAAHAHVRYSGRCRVRRHASDEY